MIAAERAANAVREQQPPQTDSGGGQLSRAMRENQIYLFRETGTK